MNTKQRHTRTVQDDKIFHRAKLSLDLFKETRVEKTQDTQVDQDDKHAYTLQANQ
jgi:hypothetical protein